MRMAGDAKLTMNEETVDDAVRAAELLSGEPHTGSVYVLGHSQGGYMMPRIVARAPKVAAAIILAGNVRSLEELIADQAAHLSLDAKTVEAIWKSVPRGYLADLESYSPAEEMKKYAGPILVLQGERDYQVTMKDFALWKAALADRKSVTFRSYPALNHLFVAGKGKSMPAEYEREGHVAEEVIRDIAEWTLRQGIK
jgi:dipeptidyl aminopeptidase/acylaminoacyl peptidase